MGVIRIPKSWERIICSCKQVTLQLHSSFLSNVNTRSRNLIEKETKKSWKSKLFIEFTLFQFISSTIASEKISFISNFSIYRLEKMKSRITKVIVQTLKRKIKLLLIISRKNVQQILLSACHTNDYTVRILNIAMSKTAHAPTWK